MSYRRPDVYVREVPTLPPTISDAPTAIPVFIGYTERASYNGTNLINVPIQINKLIDYEEKFGGHPSTQVDEINLDVDNNVYSAKIRVPFLLYDSLKLFYGNGGGRAYIISVGNYNESIELQKLKDGIDFAELVTEGTLYVIPDGIYLSNERGTQNSYELYQKALNACNTLKDRFTIIDVPILPTQLKKETIKNFRTFIGSQALNYGAAYYPYLITNLGREVRYRDIKDKVFKLGSKIEWSTFVEEERTELKNRIRALNQHVDDLYGPDGILRSFTKIVEEKKLSGLLINVPGVDNIEDIYLALQNDFYQKLNGNSEIGLIRNVLFELLKFSYRIVLSIDELLGASKITNPEIEEELESVIDLITKENGSEFSLVNSMDTLIKVDNKSNEYFGGNNDAIHLGPTFSWNADKLKQLTSSDPENLNIGDENFYRVKLGFKLGNSAFRENMRKFEKVLYSFFGLIFSEIEKVKSNAKGREQAIEFGVKSEVIVLRNLIQNLETRQITLPPSGAIAGVYASVDRDRGVFKAPANVTLSAVLGPSIAITNDDHEELNVDLLSGKSINAIRTYPGKGIVVMGGRTLAGSDSEWQYISVRRFFLFAEKSISTTLREFIMEPNNSATWVKVKTAINSFLRDQRRAGALLGAIDEDAFYVKAGLGESMTQEDLVNGRLVVEVGMAVVRPAEFIILKFSQFLPQA